MHQAYMDLFEAIKPVVDMHHLEVEVGKRSSTDDSGDVTFDPIFLSFKVNLPGLWTTMWREQQTIAAVSDVFAELHNLYSPRVVLENLIEALVRLSQNDKLKLQQLQISLNLAKAILSEVDWVDTLVSGYLYRSELRAGRKLCRRNGRIIVLAGVVAFPALQVGIKRSYLPIFRTGNLFVRNLWSSSA